MYPEATIVIEAESLLRATSPGTNGKLAGNNLAQVTQ